MNEMRDWNRTLRLNAVALRMAPALYYARCEMYDPVDASTWEEVTPEIRRAYLDMAHALIAGMAPKQEPPKPNTWAPTPYLVAKPACVKCGTRDQSKHHAPFCSHICEQAAQRRADGSEDRR